MEGSRRAQFGRLVDILVSKGEPLFVCEMLRTKSFDVHFQAFKVCLKEGKLFVVFPPHKLIDFHVYHLQVPAFRRTKNYDFYVTAKTEVKDLLIPPLM